MSNTKLKCALLYAEKTVAELAKETGIHEQTVRRAVNDKNVTVNNALKIAKALNCSVEDIFNIK